MPDTPALPLLDPPGTVTPSVTLVRRYRVPRPKVWRAWTDPEALKLWFSPADRMPVIRAEVDLRVGGRWRIVMQDGAEVHDVSGSYLEIVPAERLVFSWAWISTPERKSQVTVALRDIAGGTELTLTHERFVDEAARNRHLGGWTGSLGSFEARLGDWLSND